MAGPRIECWHVLEAATAGGGESVAVLDGDFLEGLQTIDREAGAYHGHFAHAACRHRGEHVAGCRPQPVRGPETRLKADAPLALTEQQLVGEKPCTAVATL